MITSQQHTTTNTVDIFKRIPFYYNGDDNGWYTWRWLLWLLILVPLFFIILMYCLRRRRSTTSVYYPPQELNQQYYQTQQQPPPGYVPPEYPQTYQTGGYNSYGNPDYANYGPSSGTGSQQQGYYPTSQQEYNGGGGDYFRPEGPPPAHTKS